MPTNVEPSAPVASALVAESIRFPDAWNVPLRPGYGTFPYPFAKEGVTYEQAARNAQPFIEQAISVGYRHLDTAFSYRNQDLLGAAIKACAIPRRELFVTSKLHPSNNTYQEASGKIQEAARLICGGVESGAYLDAFLLHYPGYKDPLAAWEALLEARAKGWVKHVGVSNFDVPHLEKLYAASGRYPEVNQIEFHPFLYNAQRELLAFCKARAIAVEGYSPLAEGQVLRDLVLRDVAAQHHTSPARVALRWCMQHGVRPIVGTRNFDHLKSNAEPYGFTLSGEEMSCLDALSHSKTIKISLQWQWDPKTAPLGSADGDTSGRGWLRRLTGALTGGANRLPRHGKSP